MIPSNPTFLPRPFASEGVAATIPDDKTVFGEASWREGFPTETGLPLNAGGIPPRKADFNGTLKALSEHTFFGQSGCIYPWDATLNYLANSHVVGSDGKEYAAKLASGPDDAAGAQDPTLDTEATYWADVSKVIGTGGGEPGPTPGGAGGIYNTREILTTSGTYTAPVSGWYKVTCIGGGGSGASTGGAQYETGGGGGAGEEKTIYVNLTKGVAYGYTIGAGGVGVSNSTKSAGNDGGTTSITIGDTTYSAEGGHGAPELYHSWVGGRGGGSGISAGQSGCAGVRGITSMNGGGTGGGRGGGQGFVFSSQGSLDAFGYGGGGAGGSTGGGAYDYFEYTGSGMQGCIILEYFDPDKLAA